LVSLDLAALLAEQGRTAELKPLAAEIEAAFGTRGVDREAFASLLPAGLCGGGRDAGDAIPTRSSRLGSSIIFRLLARRTQALSSEVTSHRNSQVSDFALKQSKFSSDAFSHGLYSTIYFDVYNARKIRRNIHSLLIEEDDAS